MAVAELASKSIQKGDRIKRTYSGKLDGDWGYLLVSGQKLLFVKEQGFFRKSRSVTLNLPFSKIDKIDVKSRFELEISEVDGPRNSFILDNIPVKIVEEAINEEMKKNL